MLPTRSNTIVDHRLYIGLAALLGGLLLALVLLIANVLSEKTAFADVTHNLSSEKSAPVMLPLVPPCGTLDGATIDSMELAGNWHVVMGDGAISATLTTVTGYSGQAVQLSYNVGVTQGAWVQLSRDFSPTLNLSAGDHLRFFYRGTATNTLQVGLVSATGENYFSSDWGQTTQASWWTYATWDLQDFRKDGQPFPDLSQVKAIFISVKKNKDDVGGLGSFTIDELQYLNVASRTVPSDFEVVTANPTVTQQAATWIRDQQKPSGLLKSWQEESADDAWLYDQALGLIVLSETDCSRAAQLAAKLRALQNEDGSWYAGYDYSTTLPITTSKPVGANAWTVYALRHYCWMCNESMACQAALSGTTWLSDLQRLDGSLPAEPSDIGAPTEPNLDAWWAFQATGYLTQADRLQNFLLSQSWDSNMGRFKSSPNTYQIFLDNQTWGASFLRANSREADARRALSYARWTLVTASNDGLICGFDGAGPFSVWNEGTLQYIVAQGENSQYYWGQMTSQQAPDGGLPGSPDNFRGYIVWLSRWHGVAPTSWLYFAGTGGPFYISPRSVRINGSTSGVVQVHYTFTATVSPVTATLPITYVWQASGQSPVTHTGSLSHTDAVTLTWSSAGAQIITVTATNAGGMVSNTHAINVSVPPASVVITGPANGIVQSSYTFTATVSPVTTTLPITYVWQASGQSPVTPAGSPSHTDAVTFTWSTTGTQTITVTAMNAGGSVTSTYTVTLYPVQVYLPVVMKQ